MRLKKELGDGFGVEYQGETEDGGLLKPEPILFTQKHDAEIVDDSGVLCLMDADFYATFTERVATQSDFMPCTIDAINSGTGIFWGTGSEEIWRVQIREGFSSEEGFRSFTVLLRIRSGNLILAELGKFLGGASDPLYFPHTLGAIVTEFTPGWYRCKIIQMFDPNNLEDDFAARSLDFVIEIKVMAESTAQQPWDSIPWHTSQAKAD